MTLRRNLFYEVLNNRGEFVVHTYHLLIVDHILEQMFRQRECLRFDRLTRPLELRRETRTELREALVKRQSAFW